MKLLQLQIDVKQEIGKYDIFGIAQHSIKTSLGIENHFSLLNLLIEVYYDLFQHHIAKLTNIAMHKLNFRQCSNKNVLFRGQ